MKIYGSYLQIMIICDHINVIIPEYSDMRGLGKHLLYWFLKNKGRNKEMYIQKLRLFTTKPGTKFQPLPVYPSFYL
jgi:hypothetical protein